jgi:hypothetical protein
VYTDLSWDYGVWTRPSTPFVRRHAQRIIDQDIAILARQMEVIRAHGGPRFAHSPADLIHVFIESIRTALAEGKDARLLPERSEEIELWI